MASVLPESDVRGRGNLPVPVIFTPLPPTPLTSEEQIFKSVSIPASVTMIRFAAVSTVNDTMSVSAMKQIDS